VEASDVRTGLAWSPLTEVFGDLRPAMIAVRGIDEIKPDPALRIKEVAAAKS
jgi:hypothetical protein